MQICQIRAVQCGVIFKKGLIARFLAEKRVNLSTVLAGGGTSYNPLICR